MTARAARHATQLQLLRGSTQFFPALVAAFDQAVEEIRLETYIFDFTGSGEQVALALERAARRGVRTCVLVDGVGTADLPQNWRQRFDAAGLEWRVFAPPGRWGMLSPQGWRRLHRKLCCVDGRVAFCGGVNILDDLYDPNHGALDKPRLDCAVRLEGGLVPEIHGVMTQLWAQTAGALALRARVTAVLQASRAAVGQLEHARPWRRKGSAAQQAQEGRDAAHAASLVLRDNVRHRKGIERAYLKAISQARSEVLIANAYFVPGRKLRRALVLAARRGVRVRLLLQGRYEYFMQYYAARPVYGALLEAGVEIHEYAASFLHAKVAAIDGHWATVGSSNLDPLSLLLAREANVVVHSKAFARDLRAGMVHAMEQEGERMDPAQYMARPLRQRAFEWLAYGVMRLALWLQGKSYL